MYETHKVCLVSDTQKCASCASPGRGECLVAWSFKCSVAFAHTPPSRRGHKRMGAKDLRSRALPASQVMSIVNETVACPRLLTPPRHTLPHTDADFDEDTLMQRNTEEASAMMPALMNNAHSHTLTCIRLPLCIDAILGCTT